MKLCIGRGNFNHDFIVFLFICLSYKHQYEIHHWDWPNRSHLGGDELKATLHSNQTKCTVAINALLLPIYPYSIYGQPPTNGDRSYCDPEGIGDSLGET